MEANFASGHYFLLLLVYNGILEYFLPPGQKFKPLKHNLANKIIPIPIIIPQLDGNSIIHAPQIKVDVFPIKVGELVSLVGCLGFPLICVVYFHFHVWVHFEK